MEEVTPKSSYNCPSKYQIPVIDLNDIGSMKAPRESYLQDIAKQLNHALQTRGLVYFVNHGISEERLKSVNNVFDTFRALSDDVKNHYKVNPPEIRQGYIPAGLEKTDKTKIEAREAFNIQDMSGTLPIKEVPNFVEVVGGVVEDLLNLATLVLKLISTALELDCETLLNFHTSMMKGHVDNATTFRMLYYPPLDGKQLNNFTRCGEHTDWGTFTLLTEDSEGGLEIFDGKEWASVSHMPGAILLNLGDTMELWTSSQYKAVKHRVVVPEDTKLRVKGRHSIALFVHPDNRTPVNPSFLKHCRTGEQLEESEGLNAYEYTVIKLKGQFY